MHPVQIGQYFDILSQSQRAYTKQLEPVCKKWDLTRSEVDVLLFLYNNPRFDRAADIVTRRGMAKSHVSLSVANLADLGMLGRTYSPADRRTAHLYLTESGKTVAAEAREAQKQFFDLLYKGIPEEELLLWEKITQKVCENINQIDSL
nr:winged helix-turn-helix transcriptional regulator [Oscillospiraceae bacterium]